MTIQGIHTGELHAELRQASGLWNLELFLTPGMAAEGNKPFGLAFKLCQGYLCTMPNKYHGREV